MRLGFAPVQWGVRLKRRHDLLRREVHAMSAANQRDLDLRRHDLRVHLREWTARVLGPVRIEHCGRDVWLALHPLQPSCARDRNLQREQLRLRLRPRLLAQRLPVCAALCDGRLRGR